LEFVIWDFPHRGLTLSAGFNSDLPVTLSWLQKCRSLNTLSAGFNSDSTQNWACHDARFQTRFREGRHFTSQAHPNRLEGVREGFWKKLNVNPLLSSIFTFFC